MNQLLRKTSFAGGLILLFAPIVFSSALKLISSLKGFLYTFNPEQILLYAIFLIVTVLEVVFFIKLFRAYRLHEPHAYYLVYFLGMLTTLFSFSPRILYCCSPSCFAAFCLLCFLPSYPTWRSFLVDLMFSI